ncbi:MAG: hypothetical protein SGPRY_010282, partial [Prymnesium sp.]
PVEVLLDPPPPGQLAANERAHSDLLSLFDEPFQPSQQSQPLPFRPFRLHLAQVEATFRDDPVFRVAGEMGEMSADAPAEGEEGMPGGSPLAPLQREGGGREAGRAGEREGGEGGRECLPMEAVPSLLWLRSREGGGGLTRRCQALSGMLRHFNRSTRFAR